MTLFGIISILNGIEFKLMIGEEGEVTEVLVTQPPTQHPGISTKRNLVYG